MKPVWRFFGGGDPNFETSSPSMGDPFGAKDPKAEETKIFSTDSIILPKRKKCCFCLREIKTTCLCSQEIQVTPSITIQRLDTKTIKRKDGTRLVCIAAGGYGKTHLLVELLSLFSDVKRSKFFNPFANKKISSRLENPSMEFTSNLEQQISEFREEQFNQNIKLEDDIDNASLLWVDDIPISLQETESTDWLLKNQEPFGSTIFLSNQYYMASKPLLSRRKNADFYFFGTIYDKGTMLNIYKELIEPWFSSRGSFEDFKRIFVACVKDRTFLVLNNVSCSNNVQDRLFFYKAEHSSPKFVMSNCKDNLNNDKTIKS